MIIINVEQVILASPPQVASQLLKHSEQHHFFNAKFELVKAEDVNEISGGKGAIRNVKIGFIRFKEEITLATNEHIAYQIIGKSPVSDHQGNIYMSPHGNMNNETRLTYIIHFNSPKWLPNFVLKLIVQSDIKKAMKKLAFHFEQLK